MFIDLSLDIVVIFTFAEKRRDKEMWFMKSLNKGNANLFMIMRQVKQKMKKICQESLVLLFVKVGLQIQSYKEAGHLGRVNSSVKSIEGGGGGQGRLPPDFGRTLFS